MRLIILFAIFCVTIVLSSCTGVSDWLSNSVSVDAVQHYTDAGGTSIEIVDTNAIAPVRVKGIEDGDYFEVRMIMGCSRYYNVAAETGADAPFWLAEDVFFTYDSDPAADACNRSCIWNWQVDKMTTPVAYVTAQCVPQ